MDMTNSSARDIYEKALLEILDIHSWHANTALMRRNADFRLAKDVALDALHKTGRLPAENSLELG